VDTTISPLTTGFKALLELEPTTVTELMDKPFCAEEGNASGGVAEDIMALDTYAGARGCDETFS
jgi:hypothetical protein